MSSPEEQFSDLFERTHGALLGYAVRRVTDPADAADVVAETYLVAWRRLEDVPPGAQARPWLFGVARRVLALTGSCCASSRGRSLRARTSRWPWGCPAAPCGSDCTVPACGCVR